MSPSSRTPAPVDGDAEIVRLMRERDGGGLRLLLAHHGDRARGGLKRSFGDSLTETEIDDALQAASFRAWRHIESFDAEKGTLRAWFFVIARNAGLELLRERKRLGWEPRGDELENLPDPRPQPEPMDADEAPGLDPAGVGATAREAGGGAELIPAPPRAFVAALRECIDALPRLQRRVIEADLASGDVADAGQLAKRLRTTKNSVYVTRSNARKALKKALLERGYAAEEGRRLLWT